MQDITHEGAVSSGFHTLRSGMEKQCVGEFCQTNFKVFGNCLV